MISGIINNMTRHRVAADVLMLIFLLSGIYALPQLTVSFFPEFQVKVVVISVVYRGATTTDMEESVIVPLENDLRSVPDYDDMRSFSRENSGTIVMEFPEDIDLEKALSDVKTAVERVSLPAGAEAPIVELVDTAEPVTNMTLVGPRGDELRQLARQIENELNSANFGRITVAGIPEEEIEVLVDQLKLLELNLSLAQVGRAIGAQNHDASVGKLSGLGNVRNIRASTKSSDLSKLLELPILANDDGSVVYLRDIATARRRIVDDQITLLYNGEPAVTYTITTTSDGDVIETAEKLYEWADRKREVLPDNIKLVMHRESWRLVQSRIDLLIDNGITGIMIVLAVLFIFLTPQAAFWVAAGLPIAILGTLFIFYFVGGTINMISMFALIMAIGLLVDDSIVVSESALTRFKRGAPPMRAVTSAAKTMFVPITSSAFTTVASFLPLFLITGPIGAIIFDIPLIIVCILIMATLECFLVLPGHLYRSFASAHQKPSGKIRDFIDTSFDHFRYKIFRPVAEFAVRHALATVTAVIMALVLSISLLTNNIVLFRFFPNAEGNNMYAEISFNSGTHRSKITAYTDTLLEAMRATDAELDPSQQLVEHVLAFTGRGPEFSAPGDHKAHIDIELIDVEKRTVTVDQFVENWQNRVSEIPGIDNLEISGEQVGPPGRDIEINLIGEDPLVIKEASEVLKTALRSIPDLQTINDDTSFGKEEVIFELTPLGRSLNMSIADVANQLNFAFDGYNVQSFTEGVDEIDLRVKMAEFNDEMIESLYLLLPSGEYAPLSEIVTWSTASSFDTIVHQFGQPAIKVSADLTLTSTSNVGTIVEQLEAGILNELRNTHGINYSITGLASDQEQTGKEMTTGLVLACLLIYISLTLVFSSWSIPLLVMVTLPTGLIGAILGHLIMGLDMSILSFFGVFTLMGILVNNSIVLITSLQSLGIDINDAKLYNEAIVKASVIRLRAVMVTTLTTVGGLLPLMFETSLQATFLKPMAASICFGLGFASLIILLFTPACLALHGSAQRNMSKLGSIRIRIPKLILKDN